MSTQTFTVASADNIDELNQDNANYNTAHDNANGQTTPSSALNIGQKLDGDYYVYRAVFGFDTSGLDDDAIIASAYLRMKDESGGVHVFPGNIMVKNGMPTYPHIPIEVGDYELANYSGNGGTKDVTSLDAYQVFHLNLNYTGLSWINKTGWTKFMIVSENDNVSSPPTGDEYIYISGYPSNDEYKMKLVVEYYIPSSIPVVGDPTYSNTKATYTKATANVSDDGGGYEERGFEYGISETPTWAVRETGVWGATGNYSLTLPNLLPLTTYYARAYVTNDYGTDYSEWTSFTTTDVPAYGLYEEENTATICFYISEDDGKTWGQKHGPYTTDQADIEITKLLVRGSGKKKIKFESDTLTGISASIMCKLDLKAR